MQSPFLLDEDFRTELGEEKEAVVIKIDSKGRPELGYFTNPAPDPEGRHAKQLKALQDTLMGTALKGENVQNPEMAERLNEQEYLAQPDFNIGPAFPVDALLNDYKYAEGWKEKVGALRDEHMIEKWRKIRGDGSCYYRSVAYGYFELVIARGKDALKALIGL